ncbi:MAG: deoxyribodipyrimidine photolyase, partial [Saprospiraceae bacterium]|nr:deoxyribodipyrimidine photolyase [Saprospiraceae bacterium]
MLRFAEVMLPLCNIVWFKRDLRLTDHAPLARAIEAGLPLMLCYFFEPSLLHTAEYSARHWQFIQQSLSDLQKRLQIHHATLHIFNGEVIERLEHIRKHFQVNAIFSHMEIGIAATFERDKAVQQYCQKYGIEWKEYGQDGVIRGLKSRAQWEKQVEGFLQHPLVHPDLKQIKTVLLPDYQPFEWCSYDKVPTAFQPGGETMGWKYFTSFLHHRAAHYMHQISKPEASRVSSSRVSPFLAYGNLSIRQLYKMVEAQKPHSKHAAMLEHFQTRLWWRSHYLQKLESEWQMEFKPINRGFLVLDRTLDERFEAWANAKTGFPIVDASMRCLEATGYLNFRMRAMLVTFATFTLWQDWKAVATHLAHLFLDFEPGIHYPQIQMQAGLTGYHTMRIFNPIVQAEKYDPDGIFIKKWMPELQNVPSKLLPEIWKMTLLEQRFYGCILGKDYPKA